MQIQCFAKKYDLQIFSKGKQPQKLMYLFLGGQVEIS